MSNIKAGTTSTTAITQTGDTTGVMEVLGSGGFGLKVASDGRVYGDKLHNTGTVTGTTNQYIASGTYTPTLSNVFNVASSTAFSCQWVRVGNVVTVSGRVDFSVTTILIDTALNLTIPIASALTADGQLTGTFCSSDAYGACSTDFTGDKAYLITKNVPTTASRQYYFTLMYLIL